MEKYYNLLEFDKIRQQLSELALSEAAKKKALELAPFDTQSEVMAKMNETGEAKKIIESYGSPPVAIMSGIDYYLELSEKGAMLSPDQLSSVAGFLITCGKMKKYLLKAQSSFIDMAFIGNTINPLESVSDEICNAVRGSELDDRASSELRDIRKKILLSGEKIKEKLNSMLRVNKQWFADTYISTRNGRQTLPVKKEHKSRVAGVVVDMSQTGGTYFIEPEQVRKIRDELCQYEIEEENEIRRILYMLSGIVASYSAAVKINIDAMETLDFLFAKGKLSIRMNGNHVEVSDYPQAFSNNESCTAQESACTNGEIIIRNGRHPLLTKSPVPLQFQIGGKGIISVIITGPNTGGKTVALKTAGLLSLMAQSGLHVSADGDSRFTMRDKIVCDIGDGQNITENLSTFSSHMTNIIDILNLSTSRSLVLLDELGSGTDPAEGMGLAAAILEALHRKKCLCVATTHYPEIKEFAKTRKGFVNARMAFDKESLEPLYLLEIGEAGESCALHIAKRLGMPEEILKRASNIAYKEGNSFKPQSLGLNFNLDNEMENSESDIEPEKLKAKATPAPSAAQSRSKRFALGDSVVVYPRHDIGIVYACADTAGMVGVIIKGKKTLVNHKRLKIKVAAKELYPDDYDFSIVFESVAVRKAHKEMSKHHVEGLIIHED